MVEINNFEDINSSLINIWDRYITKFKDPFNNPGIFLSPIFFNKKYNPQKCQLLIIGLNPSYSSSGWKGMLNKYREFNPGLKKTSRTLKNLINNSNEDSFDKLLDEYFMYKNLSNKKREIANLETYAGENHDYFSKMKQLAEHIFESDNPPWLHLDLFYYRKTSQNDLKELIKQNYNFFAEQINLTRSIINWLEPKVILVSNAFAGESFRGLFADSDEDFFIKYPFNEDRGTHFLDGDIPVFFSGMLSGQRALDLGSYERLKWHMKAVLEEKI